jgi:hypothetical protein
MQYLIITLHFLDLLARMLKVLWLLLALQARSRQTLSIM